MRGRSLRRSAILIALTYAAFGADLSRAASKGGSGALLPGSSSKEPVNIDAAKLDYFDKEQKLVYSGDVVARQGESSLKASVLTIFLAKAAHKDGAEEAKGDASAAGPGSSIDRMEARGPVTVISKDEVGTGDTASYDKGDNKITLVGNVTLTQATNIIRGDKLVYDMTTGQAQVFAGQTQGRVRSVFTPGSSGALPAVKKPAAGTKDGKAGGARPEASAVKTP